MDSTLTTIPLRLVVTTECNGRCPFCHHEGVYSSTHMTELDFTECFDAAAKLGIARISITGGEPTMLDNLASMINAASTKYPEIHINLTTNGFKMFELGQAIHKSIEECNLSIISFRKEIVCNYQNVEPYSALEHLEHFPAKFKSVNIVVTETNIDEIGSIIDFVISKSFSVGLMFVLKNYSEQDYALHRKLFSILKAYGHPKIQMNHIPEVDYVVGNSVRISVKYSLLNWKISRPICATCIMKYECFERVCAVRVYPDTTVTPCLNHHIKCDSDSLLNSIENIYSLIGSGIIKDENYDLPDWCNELFTDDMQNIE